MTVEAYYTCACDGQPCEGCGGYVVFAESLGHAFALCTRDMDGGPPTMSMVRRSACSDVLLPLWKGEPLIPGRPSRPEAELWRAAYWGEQDRACYECMLCEWEEIPESMLCPECMFCGECGGGTDCPEDRCGIA